MRLRLIMLTPLFAWPPYIAELMGIARSPPRRASDSEATNIRHLYDITPRTAGKKLGEAFRPQGREERSRTGCLPIFKFSGNPTENEQQILPKPLIGRNTPSADLS